MKTDLLAIIFVLTALSLVFSVSDVYACLCDDLAIEQIINHADDFDGVKEVELFLEKYPESEIFYEMVGYGYHFKHYLYTIEDTDEKVYLMMTKNTATGEFDNVISCPPNQHHDVGYAVRGSENVVRYLQDHDCFSDAAEKYFDYDLSRWIEGPFT